MPYLLFFHSESLSISNKSSQISSHSDPNVNILSNRYVNPCHKKYYTFTYHLYEILGYPKFACMNLVSRYADCHSSRSAQVDFDIRIVYVPVESCINRPNGPSHRFLWMMKMNGVVRR